MTVVAPAQFLVRATHRDIAQVRAALNGTFVLEGQRVTLRTVRTSGTIASLRHLLPLAYRKRTAPRHGSKPKEPSPP